MNMSTSTTTPPAAAAAPLPPRPPIMDPLHLTEFGSKRYYEKLKQQSQQQQQQPQQGGQSSETPALPQSQFILPLRESKPVEPEVVVTAPAEPKQKKSRFGLSRLLHSSKSQPAVVEPAAEAKRLFVPELPPKPVTRPFDELFAALPTELQIQVIASLPLSDILNLRLSSKSWLGMVTANEGPIARYHLDHNIPAYAKRLYPPADPANIGLHYLCGLWHRLHVAAKLSSFICEWVTKELFLWNTEQLRKEFADQRERMRRRLIPLLFTIFHFFETLRARHLQWVIDHDGKGLHQTPYTINPIEAEIMSMYDDRTLLQVHQVFPMVVASFTRRLRPPSYVGRAERALRGYLRDAPPDEVHVAALCIGGLRQVERFWEVKGYNARRAVVDKWYDSITKEPVNPTLKPKRGLMGFGRKKSSAAMRDAANAGDALAGDRMSIETGFERRDSLVFGTSLSDGMPMGPLPSDDLRLLLPDLPEVLRGLWLSTAEAIILDRKIVERPSDIKRNAQVMMDLVRDDGLAEEDEWWYGQGTHDSLQPNLDSMDDDPNDDISPP